MSMDEPVPCFRIAVVRYPTILQIYRICTDVTKYSKSVREGNAQEGPRGGSWFLDLHLPQIFQVVSFFIFQL
jgi:hypothetical protein